LAHCHDQSLVFTLNAIIQLVMVLSLMRSGASGDDDSSLLRSRVVFRVSRQTSTHAVLITSSFHFL